MKNPFRTPAPQRTLRKPQPSAVPMLANSSVCALYRAARVGGDFYEFLVTSSGRLVFALLDIAGDRDQALHIAASVQDRMRSLASDLFRDVAVNEADAMNAMLIELNREIMSAAGGVRCAPGFLGCYDEDVGTLTYVNAGHTPALVKDHDGVSQLDANGFPMGLFSHATLDALITTLTPGAALLLASRGLLETKAGSQEFGIDRLRDCVAASSFENAQDLCTHVQNAVTAFMESSWRRKESLNDVTAVALVRRAARAGAASAAG